MAKCKGCRRRVPYGEKRGWCAPRCFMVNGIKTRLGIQAALVKPLKKNVEGSFLS
jgi:hypothetical protein